MNEGNPKYRINDRKEIIGKGLSKLSRKKR